MPCTLPSPPLPNAGRADRREGPGGEVPEADGEAVRVGAGAESQDPEQVEGVARSAAPRLRGHRAAGRDHPRQVRLEAECHRPPASRGPRKQSRLPRTRNRQRDLFSSHTLEDDQKLECYGIQQHSTITMQGRLRGG